jgi:hypothetical protein
MAVAGETFLLKNGFDLSVEQFRIAGKNAWVVSGQNKPNQRELGQDRKQII